MVVCSSTVAGIAIDVVGNNCVVRRRVDSVSAVARCCLGERFTNFYPHPYDVPSALRMGTTPSPLPPEGEDTVPGGTVTVSTLS